MYQQNLNSLRDISIMDVYQEKSYIMVKPDGVQRGLVGTIIMRFEQRGFKLIALKMMKPDKKLLETHYQDLKDKPFFSKLIEYMLSGPVVCMIWQGFEAVKIGRALLGATRPIDSLPGTIRGDFCQVAGRNIVHGSDSVDGAKREISLWFNPKEIGDYKLCNEVWVQE